MLSTMMEMPLTLQQVLWRVEKLYANKQVNTALADGSVDHSTYGEVARRARKLASALEQAGVGRGDRVATFAWNTRRHLECYFAIPCMGAVLHTLNVRLFDDQLEYIINHAEDRIIFCDRSVLPILERQAGKMPTVKLIVLMNEGPEPSGALPNTIDYEDFLATGDDGYQFPALDEHEAAAMCYTSGTTGNPKGVVYSHRSSMLHTLLELIPDVGGMSERDTVMYAVPMFHANAWGIPFSAAMVGANQVFSDRFLDPARVIKLCTDEGVTFSAGVPTIWIGVVNMLDAGTPVPPKLKTVLCGGSAAPPSLISGLRRHGIFHLHGWGMTETSPLGSVTRLKASMETWSEGEQLAVLGKQGIIAPTVECRLIDLDSGAELPWDGVAFGELQVRGHTVTASYYNDPTSAEKFMDGWLRTSDVATIDAEGYITLVDRTKDLVKSGGEWISSVELENAVMSHPKVLEAAVVGLPHPRWSERPVVAVVAKADQQGNVTAEEIQSFLSDRVAKWWLPDEVVFVTEIPKTSVGKFAKTRLREQLAPVAARWAEGG